MSVTESLKALFRRPGFAASCEHWRTRASSDVLRDVYDGKIWQEFLTYKGQPFLESEYNLALTLNMDFFQPYKHLTYSVGVIYGVVLNLPRNIRYKRENVILIGVIPGPEEPKHDINSFLEPMVNELLDLWDGVQMDIIKAGEKVVRCAVLCTACDIPAGRKMCGFLGHSAKYGCSHCLKPSPGTVGCMDYSGFSVDTWPPRTGRRHRKKARELKNATTLTERNEKESKYGCRYTELIRLPYFDCPRMLIVDPMHNLFLGSAKHMLKSAWLTMGFISDSAFDLIQERVNSVVVPAGIGRIPHKIKSGFASFTADQWKNWVVYYSTLVLFDILPQNHLECWRHFVLACRLLCSKELTAYSVQVSNALLLQFCKKAEHLYGKDFVTPNMHMHMHLKSCVLDYGPLHGFWLFAFERYNGELGSIPNNNHSIEVQLMNRFIQDSEVISTQLPDDFNEELAPAMERLRSVETVGSLGDTMAPHLPNAQRITSQ